MATEAKKEGIKTIIDSAEIEELKKDKKKLKKMASNAEFIAEPKLMVAVGKNLGQVLGSRQKLPKPIVGSLKASISAAKSRVRISTKGKYLPTVMCMIGTENMSVDDLYDNFRSVYEKIRDKVGEQAISKVYLKTTMGTAVKIGALQQKSEEQ
jgi:large subunit ribosomal protein L1